MRGCLCGCVAHVQWRKWISDCRLSGKEMGESHDTAVFAASEFCGRCDEFMETLDLATWPLVEYNCGWAKSASHQLNNGG